MTRSPLSVLLLALPLAACAASTPPSAVSTLPAPPPQGAPLLPDIALQSAGCRAGEIAFRVTNAGRTYAAPFRVVVRNRLGEPLRQWRIEGLAEGEERGLQFHAMPGLAYQVAADPDRTSEDADPSNNALRVTCGPGEAPDLAVSGASCVGDNLYFQVVNQGTAAGRFRVHLRDPGGRTAAVWDAAGLSHGAVASYTHVRQQSGHFQVLVDPENAVGDGDRSSNAARVTCGNDGGGRQADLVLEGVACRDGRLSATVRNAGQGPAPGFEVALRADGERRILERRPIAGLHAGGAVTVSFAPLPRGRFEVEADAGNTVPDVYRGNNAGAAVCYRP